MLLLQVMLMYQSKVLKHNYVRYVSVIHLLIQYLWICITLWIVVASCKWFSFIAIYLLVKLKYHLLMFWSMYFHWTEWRLLYLIIMQIFAINAIYKVIWWLVCWKWSCENTIHISNIIDNWLIVHVWCQLGYEVHDIKWFLNFQALRVFVTFDMQFALFV